jgi:hypothetical protein
MNKVQKSEYNYLKKVILRLNKKTWDKKDFEYIRGMFDKLCLNNNIDKLSALRYGEVFLGKITKEYDLKDYNSSRALIGYIFENIDNLEVPTVVVCIGAITYIVLEDIKDESED